MKQISLIVLLLMVIIGSSNLNAIAQKLEKIQKHSVAAPVNLVIDGKTDEIGHHFEAFNTANRIFYTLANDEEKLYLAVYAVDDAAIRKIFTGGITLSLSSADSKVKLPNVRVTFPIIHDKDINKFNIDTRWGNRFRADTTAYRGKLDSLCRVANSHIGTSSKEIDVKGVAAIPDNILSVYNDDGIKASAAFDRNMRYGYELAIDIKYIEPYLAHGNKLKYEIRLNGIKTRNESGAGMVIFANPTAETIYASEPTDLSGEYVWKKE